MTRSSSGSFSARLLSHARSLHLLAHTCIPCINGHTWACVCYNLCMRAVWATRGRSTCWPTPARTAWVVSRPAHAVQPQTTTQHAKALYHPMNMSNNPHLADGRPRLRPARRPSRPRRRRPNEALRCRRLRALLRQARRCDQLPGHQRADGAQLLRVRVCVCARTCHLPAEARVCLGDKAATEHAQRALHFATKC